MALETERLKIKLIQKTDQVSDKAWNDVIEDIDKKVAPQSHVGDRSHFELWEKNKSYTEGDIIRYSNLKSNQYAICITGGQSDSTEPTNNVTGSEINVGTARFKIVTLDKGTVEDFKINVWTSGTEYKPGSFVLYGGTIYKCKTKHISDNTFSVDKDKWIELFSSIRAWKKGTYYAVGDTVLNGTDIVMCKIEHTSTSTYDGDKWEYVGNFSLLEDWEKQKDYKKGQIVIFEKELYRAKEAHKSGNTFAKNKWEKVARSGGVPDWEANKRYSKDDVVYYAKNIYRAKADLKDENFVKDDWERVTDNIKFWDDNKNEPYVDGDTAVVHNTLVTVGNIGTTDLGSNTKPLNASIATYDENAIKYPVGTTVEYKGSLYTKMLNDNENDFTSFTNAVTAGSWAKISNNQISRYDNSKTYVEGDIVFAEGAIYRAKKGGNGHKPPNDEYWEALSSAFETLIKDWKPSTKYKKDQAIAYNRYILRAKSDHTSGATIDFNNFEILYAGISTHDKSKDYKNDTIVKSVDGNLYYSVSNVPANKELTDTAFWKRLTPQTTLNDWEADKLYTTKDIVVKDGNIYRAITDSKDSIFDVTKFERLVKNNSVQLDEWDRNKAYEKDQVLTYNRLLIKSTETHNSGSEVPKEKYRVLYASIPEWDSGSYYPGGSVVRGRDGALYYSIKNVKDQDLTDDNWAKLGGLNDWEHDKQYFTKDVVFYKNDLYRAKENSRDSVFDVLKWEKIPHNDGQIRVTEWQTGKNYEVGDIVRLPGENTFYYVTKNHTSDDLGNDIGENHNLLNFVYIRDFDENRGRAYTAGEIVRYRGKLYRTGKFIRWTDKFKENDWDALDYSQAIRDWRADTLFERDNGILIGDICYKTTGNFTTGTEEGAEIGSTKAIFAGIASWKPDTYYTKGSTVVIDNELWRCKATHKSDKKNFNYTDICDFYNQYPGGICHYRNVSRILFSNFDFEADKPLIINVSGSYITEYLFLRSGGNYVARNVKITIDAEHEGEKVLFEQTNCRLPSKLYIGKKIGRVTIKATIEAHDRYEGIEFLHINVVRKDDVWEKLIYTDTPKVQEFVSPNPDNRYCEVTYDVGSIVRYENKTYICKKAFMNTDGFNPDYWELIGGVGGTNAKSIRNYTNGGEYKAGDFVYYNKFLYRAKVDVTTTTDEPKDTEFTKICESNSITLAKDWVANQEYEKDEVAVVDNTLYRAKDKVKKATFDSADWERFKTKTELLEWKPSTMYQKGDIITYNNSIYRAASDHTSTPAFEIDKWESLSGGGAGGTVAGWKQITKLNTTGNTKVTINFPETLNFCFPPIDVLQLQPGTNNVLLNSYTFDVGDGGRFEYNEKNVVFDGKVHCNTSIKVPMTEPTALGSGFTCMSDEIDFSDYNSVEGVSVT